MLLALMHPWLTWPRPGAPSGSTPWLPAPIPTPSCLLNFTRHITTLWATGIIHTKDNSREPRTQMQQCTQKQFTNSKVQHNFGAYTCSQLGCQLHTDTPEGPTYRPDSQMTHILCGNREALWLISPILSINYISYWIKQEIMSRHITTHSVYLSVCVSPPGFREQGKSPFQKLRLQIKLLPCLIQKVRIQKQPWYGLF